jgi:hypothetical protein
MRRPRDYLLLVELYRRRPPGPSRNEAAPTRAIDEFRPTPDVVAPDSGYYIGEDHFLTAYDWKLILDRFCFESPDFQLINISCPRAGPVGNLFKSIFKNGSTFMPSGPT